MSVVTAPTPSRPDPIRPFTVNEYHRMIEADILGEADPVELLAGWITKKMPRNARHDATIDVTGDHVGSLLPSEWRLRIRSAITLADSEPEPDLAVVLGPAARYFDHHPYSIDIGLLIEAADASLERDRRVKGPIYARARIPAYWIINLPDRGIEVYTDPIGQGDEASYTTVMVYSSGDDIPVVLDGKAIGALKVSDLLPPA